MGDRLKDQGAVVTGAGRGIGREIALALAAEGAKVVAVDPGVTRAGDDFDATPVNETVAEIKKRGGTAVANYSSVTDFKACGDIIKSCIENFGRLDILANIAGIVRQGMIWELSEEDWDKVIKVHLYGTFNTTKWAANIMKAQRRGRIINTTAIAILGAPDNSNYSAAKGGITSFSLAVARELTGYGVTCNVLMPTAYTRMPADKDGLKHSLDVYLEAGILTKDEYDRQLATIGVPRDDGPEHIPPIVVYLCTDEALNITGKVFAAGKGRIGIYNDPPQIRQIFNEGEIWSLDQLIKLIPNALLRERRLPWEPISKGN